MRYKYKLIKKQLKMENWQIEIKRLDKIRLELGLNWNQLEKITLIDRGQLKRFFEFANVPSMKFYFDVKVALENEFEVKFGEVEIPDDGGLLIGQVPKMENKPLPPKSKKGITAKEAAESIKEAISPCDCKLESGLLKRGKIACKKSKAEHNF